MFEAQHESRCAECGHMIRPGQLADGVGPGSYVHHLCPEESDDVAEGDVAQAEKQKSGNENVGKVACDAYGNVMAVMTEHGWEEVSWDVVAEHTLVGNAFPAGPPLPTSAVPGHNRLLTSEEHDQLLADLHAAAEMGGARQSLDRHLRAGLSTDELLANADERKALLEPAVDYYAAVCGVDADDDPMF